MDVLTSRRKGLKKFASFFRNALLLLLIRCSDIVGARTFSRHTVDLETASVWDSKDVQEKKKLQEERNKLLAVYFQNQVTFS